MLDVGQDLQQGRYRIKERLSQGGMGTVYLATDRNLGDWVVAIKENTDNSPETQQQFQREAAVLARLTHSNLPRVTDYFIEPSGRQYLVMDYIAGDDLRQILLERGEPFAEAEALAWLEPVMDALAYMHGWINNETGRPSPIVHRDIKPANIKRTPDGRTVLVDFGLAKYQTGEGTLIGARAVTPGYSPLEQYAGGTDTRSDIYALGATLYTLLTDEKPPDAPAIVGRTPLILPQKLNPKISRHTERVILRAMQIHAVDRFQSIQEMHAALYGTETFPTGLDRRGSLIQRSQRPRPVLQQARNTPMGLSLWVILALIVLLSLASIMLNLPATTWEHLTLITNLAQSSTTTPTRNDPQADGQLPPPTATNEASVQAAAQFTGTAVITATQIITTGHPDPAATATPARLPIETASLDPAAIITATAEWQATNTAASQLTLPNAPVTATAILSATPSPTSLPTLVATNTLVPTPSATATALPTATWTPSATSSPTFTATNTSEPTQTATDTSTATNTSEPTQTATDTSTATNTPLPTNTPTPKSTPTAPPTTTPTVAPTATPMPTSTFTSVPTSSPTPRPSATPIPPVPTPTPLPRTPTAGETRVNAVDRALYVYIPASEFSMGSTLGKQDEQPVHLVTLDGFWIMQNEVTNAQYARCVDVGACAPPDDVRWNDPTFADHPVANIEWAGANRYAVWAGGRLPTEAEWEKAARGTDDRTYPWGEAAPITDLLNFDYIRGDTEVVGSYPAGASPYGILDMAGNVEEWVADWYDTDYYSAAPVRNPQGPEIGVLRVLRGGSYKSNRADVRTTVRGRTLPNAHYPNVGFRVVIPDL